MTAPQVLTNSRLACFRACPRRHYLRFELGLRPQDESLALRVGSAFHRALEAADKGQDIEATLAHGIEDPFDLALVAAMFDGHRRRWAGEPLEVVASELAFYLPLVNPATGAATPVWRMAGVIDRIVRLADGRLALMEYKTTSRDFAPGAEYWLRLHLDPQLSIYVAAARELGYPVETVLYDVTRRPALKPLKATPPDARKYTKDERDKGLRDALRQELPGILNWAIEGCLAWQRSGLAVPKAVEAATEEYRSEQDVLAQFLSERCTADVVASGQFPVMVDTMLRFMGHKFVVWVDPADLRWHFRDVTSLQSENVAFTSEWVTFKVKPDRDKAYTRVEWRGTRKATACAAGRASPSSRVS